MRRRRQKNTLLPKMIGLAVVINAILLPILAQLGVFKSIGGQKLTQVEIIKLPPPEKRPAPPKKTAKKAAPKAESGRTQDRRTSRLRPAALPAARRRSKSSRQGRARAQAAGAEMAMPELPGRTPPGSAACAQHPWPPRRPSAAVRSRACAAAARAEACLRQSRRRRRR